MTQKDEVKNESAPLNQKPHDDSTLQDEEDQAQGGENTHASENPDAQIETLKKQLDAALKQIAQLKDEHLRAQAEMQNIRRRTSQDIEKARKFSLERFANDLLPVVDSLELAINTQQDEPNTKSIKGVYEGIQMTLKLFVTTLENHGLEVIDAVGHPFDPQKHEAMSIQESNEAKPNTVLNAMQKGYVLNGRVLRPAMVTIAKALSNKPKEKV